MSFDKILANTCGISAKGVPLILTATHLLNKPKNSEYSETSKKDKAIKWFKKYCGILAGACIIPTILEEWIASIN